MLYPDFKDLAAYKERKLHLRDSSRPIVRLVASGNHHSAFRGQGLEFDSVREYVPGDDIRSIDWRVTARTGSAHIKLFKEDRERHRVICVDMNATMRFGTRNTFKSIQAARAAAILGWQGLALQDPVSGCLFGDVPRGIQFFPPKRTQQSFYSLLKMLAKPPVEQHQIPLEAVMLPLSESAAHGSLIYLISDFMNLNQSFWGDASINRLKRKCDIVFIAINDAADRSIPAIGGLKVCAGSKEKTYVNTESAAGREAYALQWKKNREQLYEMTGRLKIPRIELTTESDVYLELTLGLKNIARRNKG